MTKGQIISILIAVIALGFALAIPPPTLGDGLIGGAEYFPRYYVELVFIGLSLYTALVAFKSTATLSQRWVFLIGFAIELGVFLCALPDLGFTWGPLICFAVIVLMLVNMVGPGPESEIRL